jgi:hypothetical protein
MSELIIETDRIAIPMEFLHALRAELEGSGLLTGTLSIGDITAAPEMIYFLWFAHGEPPVSMLIQRDVFSSKEGTKDAALGFLTKWQRRLQSAR